MTGMSGIRLDTRRQDLKISSRGGVVPRLRATAPGTRLACLVELKEIEETAQKCKEHLEEIGIEGCTVRAKCQSCDYKELVERDYGVHRVRGAKYEYVNGYAEITIFITSQLHDSVSNIDWKDWLEHLPGVPSLHNLLRGRGMQKLIHTCQNATSVYRKGSSDNESLEYAPDHQLSCWLSSNPEIGFIIFEVAFSQILQNARNKARDYLCRSEKPQPKVVVILNFESRAEEMFFARMKVHFEVHRQDPANAETTKIDQQGIVYPPREAKQGHNPQEIWFTLEELVGDIQFIEDAIAKRDEMVEQGLSLQSVEQQIDDLIAERTDGSYSPELEEVEFRERSLIRKSRILGLCNGLLETPRLLSTKTWITLFSRGPNVDEASEEEKDDLADKNYVPPSEEEGTGSEVSIVPKNDGEAIDGDQDEKETNDSGSPDELA